MATHQEIAQVTDEELLERMINSHDGRFDELFWDYFDNQIKPHLPAAPVIVDAGCGPGLFLRDLSARLPAASLHGYDVTRAMIDYGQQLEYSGPSPVYGVHDLAEAPLPLEDGSVDLLAMVAVLHVLMDPIAMCHEIRRLLSPGGLFLLQDWVRTPLPMYLERMTEDVPPEQLETAKARMLRLFPTHNKFSVDDWHWLLEQGGLDVLDCRVINSPHFRTFVCRTSAGKGTGGARGT